MGIDHQIAARSLLASLNENRTFDESLSQQFSLQKSYDVQFELLRQRIARGEVHAGWKVGLTSKAMQEQQVVPEPAWGT